MSFHLKKDNFNQYYFISFIIVIIGEIFISYLKFTDTSAGSLLKIIVHSYIYFSVFFLFFGFKLINIKKFNSNYLVFLLLILLFYSLFQLFRISPVNTDLYVSNPIYARFGNIWYGPMFIVPFFIVWGTNKNSIYWFEKISLNVIQVGVILFLFSLLFNFDVPYVFFISSFTLLAGFSFSNNKRRIWIILGIFISIFVFFSEEYRSGVLRILLALFCVLIVYQKIKIIKIIFIFILFLFPLFIFYDVLNNSPNIFQIISQYTINDDRNLFVDTRTFLFTETYNELKKNNDLILGLGSMGSYFSEYFLYLLSYNNYVSADFYIRSKVEVGFLQMLLKGGLFYIILISLIYFYLAKNLTKLKNTYIKNLSYISISNYFFMSIENIPAFNFLNALIWIILGVCLNNILQNKNNTEITNIFKNIN